MKQVLFCLKHPTYSGQSNPDITCKICCSIFYDTVTKQKQRDSAASLDPYKWLTGSAALSDPAIQEVQKP